MQYVQTSFLPVVADALECEISVFLYVNFYIKLQCDDKLQYFSYDIFWNL